MLVGVVGAVLKVAVELMVSMLAMVLRSIDGWISL